MSDEQLRQARHSVSQLIDHDISAMFDNLESYLLERVFTIPENVVLPEDKCQILHSSADSYDQIEDKKNELKKKIIAVKYANAQLNQNIADASALQSTLDEVLKQMSDGNISRLGAKNIKDWLSYYSEQLIKLNQK
ncbi:unnamed protein product [Lymnaea stagnalis]|uniref:Protein MIS12 homolog n=1 Tax=Lymnaea stagnalis TaxID=6523 RepID=A0AAV2HGU5_LYMST